MRQALVINCETGEEIRQKVSEDPAPDPLEAYNTAVQSMVDAGIVDVQARLLVAAAAATQGASAEIIKALLDG